MSIYSAMYAGVSGLFAQSARMGAISDNVANANTVGYKRSDVPFSTLVTVQGLSHSYSAGGVLGNPRMEIDRQGQILGTQSTTDLAIDGDGFFVVEERATQAGGAVADTLFTRAGSFLPDAEGNLRNTAGYFLKGWRLDTNGGFAGGEPARTSFASLETVNITGLNFTATPTENIRFAANLPAGETGRAVPGDAISTGVEYFDPLGNANTMNLRWSPTSTYGTWTLDVVASGQTTPVASYQVDFHTSGENSGTPRAITEIPSTVATRNLTTITDNPNTPAGDSAVIDLRGGVTPGSIGSTLTVRLGGTDYVYTTRAGDDDAANLAANLAGFLNGRNIPGVVGVSANSSGLVTIAGQNTAAGARLLDSGYPSISGTGLPAGNVSVRATHGAGQIHAAGDALALTFAAGAAAGDRIALTLGSQTYTFTAGAGADTPDGLAAAVASFLDGANVPGVSGVSAAGGVVTVTGSATGHGANLIDTFSAVGTDGSGAAKPAIEPAAGGTDADNTPLLAGDVVALDLQGLSETLNAGDTLDLTVDNTPVSITLAAADIASDVALAARVKQALDGAGLPAVASTVANNAMVTITGTTDAIGSGASLAGGSDTVRALTIKRDTTAGSSFVDANGLAVNPVATGDPIIARLDLATAGGATQQIDLSLGSIGLQEGITQSSGSYTPTRIERDGAQFGSLDRVEVDGDGIVTAVFDNGQVRPIYRIPIIDFVNPNGLTPVDGNAFQASNESGAFYMWDAGTGPAGSVASSSLENSTVDIAEEFSNMIITQRAYSSNAKIIQTADEMLQELTGLKR